MTEKNIQNIFSKSISTIIQVAQKTREDLEKELSDVEGGDMSKLEKSLEAIPDKENEDFESKNLRVFDDLQGEVDTVLRRRLICSDKFKKAVVEIKDALRSGAFVINIVAPEYTQYKGLVDLVLSEAMVEESQIIRGDDTLPEVTEKDRDQRYEKMLGNVISDIGVSDLRSRYMGIANNPQEFQKVVAGMTENLFFGTSAFDPDDPVNACFDYVRDYEKDPNAGGDPKNMVEGPRFLGRRRRSGYFGYREPIVPVDFADREFIQKSKRNVLLLDPMATPPVGSKPPDPGGEPPLIYYDERSGFPLRFDPGVENSYEYPDFSIEIEERESVAAEQIREMLENGMETLPDTVKQKWILFTKMLSALEGTRLISFFHLAGFDEDERAKSYSPEPGGGKIEVDVPEIDPDDVEKILSSFLASIGLSDNETEQKMKEAVVQEMKGSSPREIKNVTPLPSKAKKLSDEQLAKKSGAEQISYLANRYIEENPDVNWSSTSVRNWLEEQYSDFSSLLNKIYKEVVNISRTKNSSNRQVEKEASINLDGSDANQIVGKIAYAAAVELPVEQIKKTEVFKNWVDERFGEGYQDYWSGAYRRLSLVSRSFQEEENGFVKEAAAKNVMSTNLYRRLFEIIRTSEKFKAYETVKAKMMAEYVIDLLIKYLHKKCFETNEEDFNSLKSKGIVPNEKFMGVSVLSVPFGEKEKLKFNIRSNSDVAKVFYSGASILISSNDGSETLTLSNAVMKTSVGGPILTLQFSSPPKNNYNAGNYVLTVQESSFKLEGLVDDIYSNVYRQNAKKVKEQHKKNSVSLNLSIYPSWVPSPYDYRHNTSSREDVGCGHPNNAYNIQVALNKRIALRERYLRKNSYREDKKATVQRAVRRLEQEIGEMQLLLHHVSANVPTAKLEGRRTDSSMVRNNKEPLKDSSYYKEVVYRCSRENIDIGSYGPHVGTSIIKGFLSPEKYNRFLQIAVGVKDEMKNRKNVFILRHVDVGLTASGGNGFLSLGSSEGGSYGASQIRTWNPAFQAAVSNLYGEVSKSADPSSRKTHIVIISEAQIPSFFTSDSKKKKADAMKVVYLATNTISTDEIESLFQYYQFIAEKKVEDELRYKLKSQLPEAERKKLQRQLDVIAPKDESGKSSAPQITVPVTVIRKAQSMLSNLGFSAVEDFIKKTCLSLVSEHSKGKKLGDILTVIMGQVNEDVERLRSQDEVLAKIGIKAAMPKVGLNDYVTQAGSEWNSHVRGFLADVVNKISSNNSKIDLFRRCLDLRILPGNIRIGPKEKDGSTLLFFKNPLTPNDSVGKLLWFDCDPQWGAAINSCEPIDPTVVEYSSVAGFNVEGEILSHILSDPQLSKYNRDDGEGLYTTLMRSKQNIGECVSSVSACLRQLEDGIKAEKAAYPVFVVLEGDPGTGKSIFAEVLANCLDCKLLTTTFDEVFYSSAGEPKLRGGFEENVTKFFDVLGSFTDTVLLIDEVDKFLVKKGLDSSKGDVDKVLAQMQSRWESGGSGTSDVGKYKKNNLHIVLTTNDWNSIVKNLSALASRLKPKFNVPLPADFKTLKEFFSGSAIINNLINNVCNSDPILVKLAKDLKDVYDKTDEKSVQLKEDIIAKINEYDASFFTRASIIRPSVAEKDLANSRSIPFKGEVDQVKDFVFGWQMIENLIAGLGKGVTREVEGEKKSFVPLDIVCRKLSEILVVKSEASGTTYARGNMRELMTVFNNMFAAHQDYLSGRSAIPFNFKSLYVALSNTRFQFSEKDRVIEPQDARMLSEIASESSEDGFNWMSQFVPKEGVEDPMKPSVEFWYTKENFAEIYDREQEFSKKAHLERNNDGGLDFMMERLRENLMLSSPDNPDKIDVHFNKLVEFSEEMISVGSGANAESLKAFLDAYRENKNVIQQQYLKYVASKDSTEKSDIFNIVKQRTVGIAKDCSNLKLLNVQDIFTSPQARRTKAGMIWGVFIERLERTANSLGTVVKLDLAKSAEGREQAWNTIKKRNTEKMKNVDQRIAYFSSLTIDAPISNEEYERFVRGKMTKKIFIPATEQEMKQGYNSMLGIDKPEIPPEVTLEPAVPTPSSPELPKEKKKPLPGKFPPPEIKGKPGQKPPPGEEFDDINLNEPIEEKITASTTDYYYAIAQGVIAERAKKEAQNQMPEVPPQIQQPNAAAQAPGQWDESNFFNLDFGSLSKALMNRDRMFSSITGLPFMKHSPTTSGSFINDVPVLRIETPFKQDQKPPST